MQDLKSGTKLQLMGGGNITVKFKIGEGGQGAVYKVVDDNGKEYALKWYHTTYLKSLKNHRKKFCENLSNNVKNGSPSNSFLWPKAIAYIGKRSIGIGYVMELRPQNYCEFTKFMKAKEHFAGTQVVINTAINVVEGFQALHRRGLSYQDLSPGNFFIDKDTGEVLICDNDNVAPYGINLGINGTPGHMAPEVILGKARPDINTDLFSLSVILFELFFLSHPLEGANCCKYPCLTPEIERELYAEKPIFVMSETDKSNLPVRGAHTNLINLWGVYPKFLRDAFQKALGEGLKTIWARMSEGAWLKVLYKLRDNAVTCPKCKELNFADKAKGAVIVCDVCKRQYPVPFSLAVSGNKIYVEKDKQLTEYHTAYGSIKSVVGTVIESKKTPGTFGLRNDSNQIWKVVYPEKPMIMYENGKTVSLIPETEITIGNCKVIVKKVN